MLISTENPGKDGKSREATTLSDSISMTLEGVEPRLGLHIVCYVRLGGSITLMCWSRALKLLPSIIYARVQGMSSVSVSLDF